LKNLPSPVNSTTGSLTVSIFRLYRMKEKLSDNTEENSYALLSKSFSMPGNGSELLR